MGNEYDYKGKHFEATGVSRAEFEALKRFGDYEELHDGTLMRAEGNMEFRTYCEDVEGCPIGIVTEGILNVFANLRDDAPREAQKQGEFWIESARVTKANSQGFYSKLSERLAAMDFARQVWALCAPAYCEESRGGRPGIGPVVIFR